MYLFRFGSLETGRWGNNIVIPVGLGSVVSAATFRASALLMTRSAIRCYIVSEGASRHYNNVVTEHITQSLMASTIPHTYTLARGKLSMKLFYHTLQNKLSPSHKTVQSRRHTTIK